MDGVRESETADHPRLAAALARAFHDDPVSRWSIPPERLRNSVLTGFFSEYLRQKQRYGTVWCDDELTGAAIWAPPGRSKMGILDTLGVLLRTVRPRLVARGPMLGWGAMQVERLQPDGDFFYLAALGVDPAAQGRGLGSKLMAPVLEICDTDRVGAYLESSKPDNVDFYARHGFRVVAEHKLPRGPVLPLMYREPLD